MFTVTIIYYTTMLFRLVFVVAHFMFSTHGTNTLLKSLNMRNGGIVFSSLKGNSSVGELCAVDKPSGVITRIRSKTECMLRCMETDDCAGINLRGSDTCEILTSIPNKFTAVAGCVFYYAGKLHF